MLPIWKLSEMKESCEASYHRYKLILAYIKDLFVLLWVTSVSLLQSPAIREKPKSITGIIDARQVDLSKKIANLLPHLRSLNWPTVRPNRWFCSVDESRPSSPWRSFTRRLPDTEAACLSTTTRMTSIVPNSKWLKNIESESCATNN